MKLYAGGQLDFYLLQHRSWVELELKEPTRLSALLVELGIPLAEVHLVVLNGQLVDLQEVFVCGQDEVKLYPAVNGG
jgi:sulfur carrier protein ThiS